jgi:DNA protecting protein DprA
MERALYCLSHIYSQLRGTWPGIIEISDGVKSELFCKDLFATPLFEMSLEDWKYLVRFLVEDWPEILRWLPRWCREKDNGGERLSEATFRHLQFVRRENAHYITYDQAVYPNLLRYISDPPLAISLTGNLEILQKPQVSIIGSRKASVMALEESFSLARSLSDLGYAVVSGGAFGCDIAAHQGALASELFPVPTISVAASGLARLYPVHNQQIFYRIKAAEGVILSERLWWEGCRPRDFAVRNRIISGLSATTCVMQAGMKSGALLTAKHSLNQGREVLVLRHPEYDVRADGSRWLEDDGAVGFSSASEIRLKLFGPLSSKIFSIINKLPDNAAYLAQ